MHWVKGTITIRQYVESFIQAREMSISALASKLGYKSTNSLYRIMDERVRPSSLKQFESRMLEQFALSEDEQYELTQAVETKEQGEEKAAIYSAMATLIEGFQNREIKEAAYDSKCLPNELADRYGACSEIVVHWFNSLQAWVIDQIGALLEQTDAQVVHYMNVQFRVEESVRNVGLLTRILFHPRYCGYVPRNYLREDEPKGYEKLNGITRGDVAFCSFLDQSGTRKKEMLVFTELGIHYYTIYSDIQLEPAIDMSQYQLIKHSRFEMKTVEDYKVFFRECAALDMNHASYMLKPDFGVGLVSGDMLIRLVQEDKCKEIPGIEWAHDELRRIFTSRCNHNFSKKKHAFYVMTRSAMRRFIRTGLMSDHFWLLRPFTPEERLEVLRSIFDNLQQNKYLHFYFLKDESVMGENEVDLYDGEGILIQSNSTAYQLSGSHAEIMLTHPEVMNWYREYFLSVLIKMKSYSEADSEKIMADLVKECEELVQKGEG